MVGAGHRPPRHGPTPPLNTRRSRAPGGEPRVSPPKSPPRPETPARWDPPTSPHHESPGAPESRLRPRSAVLGGGGAPRPVPGRSELSLLVCSTRSSYSLQVNSACLRGHEGISTFISAYKFRVNHNFLSGRRGWRGRKLLFILPGTAQPALWSSLQG